mgnify:CR=1 FL=1
MVKHTIRPTNAVAEGTVKPGLQFYLDMNADGEVQLVGKDENGVDWHILAVANNSKLTRYTVIPNNLGLQVKETCADQNQHRSHTRLRYPVSATS